MYHSCGCFSFVWNFWFCLDCFITQFYFGSKPFNLNFVVFDLISMIIEEYIFDLICLVVQQSTAQNTVFSCDLQVQFNAQLRFEFDRIVVIVAHACECVIKRQGED